jgi:hypothetical protein
MSRSWTSPSRAFLAILVAILIIGGCAEEEYELSQQISMGPWMFQVEQAREQVDSQSGNTIKSIFVTLRLDNYTQRHDKTFDDFVNETSPGSVIADPRLKLVDSAGEAFVGLLHPKSGGRMRSERWEVKFVLISDDLNANVSERAEKHLRKHPSDFRLVIENPDHRRGQPRRASVQLE